MGKKWHRFRNPWDREYAKRGRLWRGAEDAHWLRAWVAPGTRLLELASGDGKFLAALADSGFEPVGLDFSPHALRLSANRRRAPLVLGDIRRLPVPDAVVASVALRYGLGALQAAGRAQAAREAQRILAPRGRILLEEFSTADFRYGAGREVEPGTFERNQGLTTHYFRPGEMEGLFPHWTVLHREERSASQRTRAGTKARARLRLVLEKPS